MPTCPWGNGREKRPGNNCWLKGKKGKAEGWGGGRTEQMMGSGRGHQLGTRELRGVPQWGKVHLAVGLG